jgi:nicotinate-nucleotide--dimethylbenzimidazole phosphoribosyltransferase
MKLLVPKYSMDKTIAQEIKKKINQKTKPPGSLGQLENIALQVGLIQNTVTPAIHNPHIVVFAGDHGIAANGIVNPYPQSVTAQMVYNFVHGGAAINVFCRQNNIALKVVDAGVKYDFDPALPIIHASAGKGTSDYSKGNAMQPDQVKSCLEKGRKIVADIHQDGCNCIGFGEMGIGNTSSAALMLHYYSTQPVEDCVGNGTGANDEQLIQKKKVLTEVSQFHRLDAQDLSPIELLSKIGGFEMAMMAGAYLKAKELGMIIVVDGFIATAALMIAHHIQQEVLSNCIFAHCSDEQGHRLMLEYFKVKPLLNLGLRLGEGTGAALAIPLIQNAVAFLNEMASFESAGVDGQH